jgi:hypothetical protein
LASRSRTTMPSTCRAAIAIVTSRPTPEFARAAGGWAARNSGAPVGASASCHCSPAARSAGSMNARPAAGSPLAARHAAIGSWEHSGRELHSHVRDLGFCGRSYNDREILAVIDVKHAIRLIRRAPNTCPGIWPGAPSGGGAERSSAVALHHDEARVRVMADHAAYTAQDPATVAYLGPMAASGPAPRSGAAGRPSTITWE